VVILGDSTVGKSSLTLRYLRNEFSDAPVVTIGANVADLKIDVGNGQSVPISI